MLWSRFLEHKISALFSSPGLRTQASQGVQSIGCISATSLAMISRQVVVRSTARGAGELFFFAKLVRKALLIHEEIYENPQTGGDEGLKVAYPERHLLKVKIAIQFLLFAIMNRPTSLGVHVYGSMGWSIFSPVFPRRLKCKVIWCST